MGLTFSSSVMRVLIWVSIIICYLYIAEAFPQKKDKQGKGEDLSDSKNSKKSDKQGNSFTFFDGEAEGSEAADGDLSSTIEDTKAGTAMIENMIDKLKKMNKFLAGIVGYWDNEAESGKDGGAEGGSEDADKDGGEVAVDEAEEEKGDKETAGDTDKEDVEDGEKEEADETDKEDVEDNEDAGVSDKDDTEGDSDKDDTEGDSDKDDTDGDSDNNEDAGNGDTDVVEDGDDSER